MEAKIIHPMFRLASKRSEQFLLSLISKVLICIKDICRA
jgi:hypothetical protein